MQEKGIKINFTKETKDKLKILETLPESELDSILSKLRLYVAELKKRQQQSKGGGRRKRKEEKVIEIETYYY